MSVTVSSKGQVTLPADIRRRLGITAGTQLEFIVRDDEHKVVALDADYAQLQGS